MNFFLHVGHSSGQMTEGLQEEGGAYYTFRKIKKERDNGQVHYWVDLVWFLI